MTHLGLSPDTCLPDDGLAGILVGRIWIPGENGGPTPVAVTSDGLMDLTAVAPTVSQLLNGEDPLAAVRGAASGTPLAGLETVLANSDAAVHDPAIPHFLAPSDLQAVKAAGVTFVASMLERVIEEHARGDAAKAEEIRERITAIIGDNLADIDPGSKKAAEVKEVLIAQGAWSQYLEVGIGPDAELFTKCQPLSAVGIGADVGIHPISSWNNPEPEVVLVVNARGGTVGATLGNDVNLRDVEGRSALLLGKAKDNNASAAIGPFIRLFDDTFGIDDVRRAELSMTVDGADGYRLTGTSSMARISRDPLDIAAQAIGPNHQYPDGFVLFLGTMFAPTDDRDHPGGGFTHKIGDVVRISTPGLGTLINRVDRCDRIPPWTFGTGALMGNLAARGLL